MKFLYALATFAGTLIGVGFFSLPYLASKTGLLIIFLELIVLGAIVIAIHLLLAEVVIATPTTHMLPGYAKHYLGRAGGIIAAAASILSIFLALLAYLIVGGGFLQNLLAPASQASPIFYILIYFSLGAFLIFFEVKGLGKSELVLLAFFFLILIIFSAFGWPKIKTQNISFSNIKVFYLPLGAILFSLWATSIVPGLRGFFDNQGKLNKTAGQKLRAIIILGIILGIICYFIFSVIIFGLGSAQTSRSALSGLAAFLPGHLIWLGLIFGIIATFTSFIGLGFALKKTLILDLKINKYLSWTITCFGPLFLYIIGVKDFIKVISITGGFLLAVEGVLIILMYAKMKTSHRRQTPVAGCQIEKNLI